MCIKRVKNWVKPPELPYPEEAEDPTITIDNIDFHTIRHQWFDDYWVPIEHWSYWEDEVEVILGDRYTPAASSAQTMRLWVNPRWANSGILAHEYSHISYGLLTRRQKDEFGAKFDLLKDTNPLLNLAYTTKPYMTANRIEAHADTYRYLGDKMPEELKGYYPKLLF